MTHAWFALFLIAQLSAVAGSRPRHRTVDVPEVTVVDAGAPSVATRGHEPSEIANTSSEPTRVPAVAPPTHSTPPHAPWWLYGMLLFSLLWGLYLSVIRLATALHLRGTGEHHHESTIQMSDKEVEHYDNVIEPPKNVQQYMVYVGGEGKEKEVRLSRVLPAAAPPRTDAECRALYLAGLEAFVQRCVWPEELHIERLDDEPVENRWRAWLGNSWDKALQLDLAATGKGEGQALKTLLRKYKRNGGEWLTHAIECAAKAKAAARQTSDASALVALSVDPAETLPSSESADSFLMLTTRTDGDDGPVL